MSKLLYIEASPHKERSLSSRIAQEFLTAVEERQATASRQAQVGAKKF